MILPQLSLVRLGVAAACLTAVFSAGWFKGADHVQAQWDDAAARTAGRIVRVQARQAEASVQVVTQYVDRVQTVYRAGQTITKEVPVYVPATTPDLPGGFRLLHDAAATGAALDASGGANAPPVSAQDVAATIAENYTSCRATAEQLKALQQWEFEQQSIQMKE